MVIGGSFGPWRPDLPELNNLGVTRAHNVLPSFGQNGITYKPIRSLVLYSSTSMSSRPLGTALARATNGETRVYGGSASNLYKLDQLTRLWTDMSKTGGYGTSDSERWAFTDYGNLMLATNFNDYPQYVVKDTNVKFDNLTTLCRGRYPTIIKDFYVLANTWDSLDFDRPYRVRWSAYTNPFDFNYSAATMSDFQDIFEGGSIQGIVGGEAGYVIMQDAIVKMTFIGAPLIFQFDNLLVGKGKGCNAPTSIITVQGMTFYLSGDGFYMLQGDNLTPIGAGKSNYWFLNRIDQGQFAYMTAAADPTKNLVYWCYCSKGGTLGIPDSLIIYNYVTGEWTEADATVGFIFNSISLPTTLEDLGTMYPGGLETIPAPLDSNIWSGNTHLLWAMDGVGNIYSFDGPNMQGVIETQEQYLMNSLKQINPNATGDKTTITKVRPLFQGTGRVSVKGMHRSLNSDNEIETEITATHPETQQAYMRYTNRFHKWRFIFESEWEAANGYEVDAQPAGFR
jgi:hypothetical protein